MFVSANYFGKCILFTCSEEALRLCCLNRKFGSNKMGLLRTPRQIIAEAITFTNSKFKKKVILVRYQDKIQYKPLQVISFFPHSLPFNTVKADPWIRESCFLCSKKELRPPSLITHNISSNWALEAVRRSSRICSEH